MGITASDVKLIERALAIKPEIKTVLELGSQNLYLDNDPKPPFASGWYQKKGLLYSCIDLAGDNGAMKLDLSKEIDTRITWAIFKVFDLVTDFGTAEHVVTQDNYQTVAFHGGHINSIYPINKPSEEAISEGFYNCWRNKHNLLAINGLMINVNPKTGNWPEHGYTYLSTRFYEMLAEIQGYEIIDLSENAAMGNIISGWNVVCILRKMVDNEFMSFEKFKEIDQFRK